MARQTKSKKHVGTVGTYIRQRREDARLRLQDLSEKAHLPVSYLSMVERGGIGAPSPDRLVRIAVVLGADPAEMLVRAGHLPQPLWRLAQLNPRALTDALTVLAANTDQLAAFGGSFDLVIANPPWDTGAAQGDEQQRASAAFVATALGERSTGTAAPQPVRVSEKRARKRKES